MVLSENVTATTDIQEALKDAILVLCCFPVQVIPDILEKNKALFDPNIPFCSCSKGTFCLLLLFPPSTSFSSYSSSYTSFFLFLLLFLSSSSFSSPSYSFSFFSSFFFLFLLLLFLSLFTLHFLKS